MAFNLFKNKKATKEENNSGSFVGFVLLEDDSWDMDRFGEDLAKDWGITYSEKDETHNENSLVFEYEGMMCAVSLMPAPIPNDEALENARNNFMWEDAVEVTARHQAHLMIAVLGTDADMIDRSLMMVKLVASACKSDNVLGVYMSGTVFEPEFYIDSAQAINEGYFPVTDLIWFGLYRGERGVCAYTYGMQMFGKDNIEILDTTLEPPDLYDFLVQIATYVITSDVTLKDGETIGFSEDQKCKIKRSPGVSLPAEEMTIKVTYAM
ncbi:MAG: DUF4261 domain-containing protein [Peptostreptococcaceae bacterium]|nr:DUF4261 domain-containing protein [Peptostreptococcaceae bacterium]